MQNALDQIQQITDALNKIKGVAADTGKGLEKLLNTLDALTADHTGFKTFSSMVHALGGYVPSIYKAPAGVERYSSSYRLPCGRTVSIQQYYAELDLLALCYDMAQEARGDKRRAFRS